jgi:hypothetical protein
MERRASGVSSGPGLATIAAGLLDVVALPEITGDALGRLRRCRLDVARVRGFAGFFLRPWTAVGSPGLALTLIVPA